MNLSIIYGIAAAVALMLAVGCDDFITKPVLPLLIKEIVHTMTERSTKTT